MEFFAKDNYLKDINDENTKGEIARPFGELIKLMWSGEDSFVTPRVFIEAVTRLAPQMSGCQDQQEFVKLMLDGLHKDLTRIKRTDLEGRGSAVSWISTNCIFLVLLSGIATLGLEDNTYSCGNTTNYTRFSLSCVNGWITSTSNIVCNVLIIRRKLRLDNEIILIIIIFDR